MPIQTSTADLSHWTNTVELDANPKVKSVNEALTSKFTVTALVAVYY
jgi:hypothetical protein